MTRLLRFSLALAASFTAFQPNAHAWGPVAHETIGLIAETHLSKPALAKVKHLLSGASLGQVSTWPDSIRQLPEWDHTKSYHFALVPDGEDFIQSLRNLGKNELSQGDVVRSVLRAEDMLRSPKTSDEQKLFALVFLDHFFADFHQPFHTGRPEDRGGNNIRFNFGSRKTNLHQAWDSVIIEAYFAKIFKNRPVEDKAKIYAKFLLQNRPKNIKSAINGYVDTWFGEALNARDIGYAGPLHDPKQLAEQAVPVINDMVLKAGLRLAALLNDIFDPNAPDRGYRQGSLQLRKQIGQVLGSNIFQGVTLDPGSTESSRPPANPLNGDADRFSGVSFMPAQLMPASFDPREAAHECWH